MDELKHFGWIVQEYNIQVVGLSNLLNEIKIYWDKLKTEYEDKYKESFLIDYEKSKEYIEKMEIYLLYKHEEYPSDIDIACTLASVKLELRCSESDYINFLKDFLRRFENSLDNNQKARIYTNIAFYNDFIIETLEYLLKAKDLDSPFVETYTGLGLYYFSEYQSNESTESLALSQKYFEIAKNIDDGYKYQFNFAVSLYELKEYEKAKKIFLELLKKHPDRMRLMLSVAYCEVYLGNKDRAISYLEKVKPGEDENYDLSTDDISDNQIIDAYYVLEEYDKFLHYYSNEIICQYYTADWEHYYYTLWLKNKKAKFFELEEKNRRYFEEAIKEAIADDDYETEEDKKQYIDEWEIDKKTYEDMIARVKSGASKPIVRLELYPEFSCFMVDCVRHKF